MTSPVNPPSRAVMTLALGPALYLELAANLARSFLHWNRDGDISFHIITDQPATLPPDLAAVRLITVSPGQYGTGFSTKLWLDQIAPADQNLFVDSDCLCFGNLGPVFDRFAGRPAAVVGEARTTGHFFGDIPALCAELKLPWMASFVGCVYYLERGPAAIAVYEEARRLEKIYDQIGLIRLRDVPNDEPLMALALARFDLKPVPDDGTIKADAMYYGDVRRLNVVTGEACVAGPRLADHNRNVLPMARPVLFHFNSHFTEGRHYRREIARLRLMSLHRWPTWLASVYARLVYDWPRGLADFFKDLLRPVYRVFFGAREVQTNGR